MKEYFIPIEVARQKIFKKYGTNIELLKYKSLYENALFLCNICGNEWNAIPYSAQITNGCVNCKNKKFLERNRTNFENVKNFIKLNKCEYISGEYRNNRSKLKIKFECGHIGIIDFNDFKNGNRCYDCGRIKSNLSKRVSSDKIMEIARNSQFEFISFPNDYINRLSEIEFKCKFGHYNRYKIREFLKSHSCKECTKIRQSLNQTGSKGSNWQGGLTELKSFLKKYIKDWKKESMKNSNYKCIISGKRFQDIHHLQSFNLLLKECLNELNLDLKNTTGEYSEDELFLLANKIREVHYRYPLGVCLTREWHNKFHKEYGIGNNTPSQFYEFQQKIASGEITI